VGGIEVYLPLAGMIDLEAERVRLSKELEKVQDQLARSERTLSNPDFAAKAPPEVVEKERAKMNSLREQANKLRERLGMLMGER
ncbi:MAG: hypothetical protein NZ765_11225, partial [Anaerolineae bacterium]|nr:hypothetical protein [Anaerolineae bacterium]MDW8072182.1 hypothetical protein [Anaerolineae bacterium]